MIDQLTLNRLRELDAAPLDQRIDRDRQAELLNSLLATDPDAPSDGASSPLRRPVRRVVWGAAAAVLVAATSVALSLAPGGQPAFATWTRQPTVATEQDGQALRSACLDQVGETVGGDGAPLVAGKDLLTRLVDRRGDWVSVLLTWTGSDRYQFTVACLGELQPGSSQPDDVTYSVSGGGGWAAPTGHELVEGPTSEFSVGGGFLGLGRTDQAATTNGDVGPDVVAVTIHAGTSTVEASVADGTYAAWWPGRVVDPTTRGAGTGEGGPASWLRYDLTLRDGTVLRDVHPVHPTR